MNVLKYIQVFCQAQCFLACLYSTESRRVVSAIRYRLYDPKKMDDFPVGVQSIATRFEEEKVLGVAAVLERLLKAR